MDEVVKALETIKEYCESQNDCLDCLICKFCDNYQYINPCDWNLDILKQGEK